MQVKQLERDAHVKQEREREREAHPAHFKFNYIFSLPSQLMLYGIWHRNATEAKGKSWRSNPKDLNNCNKFGSRFWVIRQTAKRAQRQATHT